MNAPIHKELPAHLLNAEKALSDVTHAWDSQILKELTQYIEVPAKSPSFDANWEANGYLDTVLRQTAQWIEAQKVAGLSLEIVRLPGRTPVLFFEVAATRPSDAQSETVLMYGHLDKQPEFSGWRNDLGPWTPVLEGSELNEHPLAPVSVWAHRQIMDVGSLTQEMRLTSLEANDRRSEWLKDRWARSGKPSPTSMAPRTRAACFAARWRP